MSFGVRTALLSTSSSSSSSKSSFFSASFNLVNTILGAGTLALPFAFKSAGLILGSLVTVLVGLLSLASAFLLIDCSVMSSVLKSYSPTATTSSLSTPQSYRRLVKLSFGPIGSYVVELFIIVFLMGACISYVVIIGEVLAPYIKLWTQDPTSILTDDWFIQILATTFVLLPLSLIPTLHSLRFTSTLAIIGILFLVITVFARFYVNLSESLDDEDERFLELSLWSDGILRSVPIVTFAFTMHTQLIPIWKSMKNPTISRVKMLMSVSLGIACVTYLFVGAFGYLSFFDLTKENLLLNYVENDILIDIAKFAYVMIIAFSYPLMLFPARLSFDSLVSLFLGPDRKDSASLSLPGNDSFVGDEDEDDEEDDDNDFDSVISRTSPPPSLLHWRRVIEVVLLVYLSYFAAIFIPDISFVFGLTGSTAGSFVVYIVPSLVYLRLHSLVSKQRARAREQREPSRGPAKHYTSSFGSTACRHIIALILILAGFFFMVGGLFELFSDKE